MKFGQFIQLMAGAAVVVFCSSCEELPSYVERPLAAFAPQPSGYWNGEGVSGSPKIVVRVGEQKAYFYKGKRVVGESTVSTGKPGFSTPPGSYSVVSKSADHVSTIFGDYVDDSGNVVSSHIDARKDRRPSGTHCDGPQVPYAMSFSA